MAVNKLITLELLSQYNVGILGTIDTKIAAAVDKLGDVFNIKGRKDSATELTAIADAQNGDVWLVGAEGSDAFEEYYYLNGAWEYMGTTAPTLDGYVTETLLYKGADGTGTTTVPAAGTILAQFKTLVDANTEAIAAINNETTGIAATAKSYTDTEIGKTNENVAANTEAIAAINNADTGIAATAKSYTDTEIGKTNENVAANAEAIETLQTNVGALGECALATTDEVNNLIPATT